MAQMSAANQELRTVLGQLKKEYEEEQEYSVHLEGEN